MLWLFAEDNAYYSDLDSLAKEYSLQEICPLPSLEDVKSTMRRGSGIGYIAPFLPPREIYSLFAFKNLPI